MKLRVGILPIIPSPVAKLPPSANVAPLELGIGALREDLVTTNALRASSHRYPSDGKLRGTRADLGAIRVAN